MFQIIVLEWGWGGVKAAGVQQPLWCVIRNFLVRNCDDPYEQRVYAQQVI